jgi:hypothetical protein
MNLLNEDNLYFGPAILRWAIPCPGRSNSHNPHSLSSWTASGCQSGHSFPDDAVGSSIEHRFMPLFQICE